MHRTWSGAAGAWLSIVHAQLYRATLLMLLLQPGHKLSQQACAGRGQAQGGNAEAVHAQPHHAALLRPHAESASMRRMW